MNPLTLETDNVQSSFDQIFAPSIDSVLVSSAASHASGFSDSGDEMTLRGRSEPGSRVLLQSGEQRLGTALVNGQGEWSFATIAQNPGAHCVSVIAVSAFGLESSVGNTYDVQLNGAIATLAPAVTQASALQETIFDTHAPMSVNLQSEVDQDAIQLSQSRSSAASREALVESESAVLEGMVDLTTLADQNVALAPAPLAAIESQAESDDVQVAQPKAGAAQSSASLNSVLDDTVQGGSVINSGEATHDRTPTLRGSGEVGSQIVIYSNDVEIGDTLVDDTGSWSFTPAELSYGEHRISVVAIDLAGLVSAPSPPFLILIEPVLIVGGAPTMEPVAAPDEMATWDELADGSLPWVAPVNAPHLTLVVDTNEPSLDFSLVEQSFEAFPLEPELSPSLVIENLLTEDASELFQPLDEGLANMQPETDVSSLIDGEGTWSGLDEISSGGMEHAQVPTSLWPLESDDPSLTPLI